MSWDGGIGVVFDVGSQWLKAGFAGEPFPRAVCKSAVGRFRRSGLLDGVPDVYCGLEAMMRRGVSNLSWPVQGGLIENWDDIEKLWYHTFYKELLVAPEEARVMHAVHPLIPEKQKEQMAEMLFENFVVQSIYLAASPTLVLHASGKTSGMVWENGYACCYATPIFEGFPLKHSIVTSQLTGEAITRCLQSLMSQIGYSFTTDVEMDLLEKIKAKLCYVASDYEAEIASVMCGNIPNVSYELPDGQKVNLGEERFQTPEILFRPSLQGLSCPSIVDDICKSINYCDIDYHSLFYDNIVISGGTSNFSGLDKRLLRELSLRTLSQPGTRPKVDAPEMREHATWRGGALLAMLEGAKGCWMTRQEYEDNGAKRVHHKFF